MFAHANEQWANTIRGRFHYFGSCDALDGALQKYLDEKQDLQAGGIRVRESGNLTTADLVNA